VSEEAPSLDEVFAPIAAELRQLETRLESVKRPGFPQVALVVASILRPSGKRIRPALTLLTGRLYDRHPELVVAFATGVELLHTATLVHDDIVDGSLRRRNQPTALAEWNVGPALLAGDWLFANSCSIVASTGNQRVIQRFAETLMVICSGELDQLFSTQQGKMDITREEYFRRISAKTAALFEVATEGAAVLSGAPEHDVEALRAYGYHLGIAFQMIDDILDFIGDPEELGKPVGGDLAHGIVTLPTLAYLERSGEENVVHRYLQTRAPHYLTEAIEAVRTSPAIEEAYREAEAACGRALAALKGVSGTERALAALERLPVYLLRRKR
jgi:octaprenyl-diphosphate synthase